MCTIADIARSSYIPTYINAILSHHTSKHFPRHIPLLVVVPVVEGALVLSTLAVLLVPIRLVTAAVVATVAFAEAVVG